MSQIYVEGNAQGFAIGKAGVQSHPACSMVQSRGVNSSPPEVERLGNFTFRISKGYLQGWQIRPDRSCKALANSKNRGLLPSGELPKPPAPSLAKNEEDIPSN